MTRDTHWAVVGAYAQALVVDGAATALVFVDWSPHGSATGAVVDAYEFWWAPLDALDQREVMFGWGWGPDDAERWRAAWEQARKTATWLHDEWLADRDAD